MRLTCPNCLTEYEVPDAAVAGRARTLRCAYCGHQWRREAEVPEETAAPDPAPLIDAPPLLAEPQAPTAPPPAAPPPAAPFYSARQEAAAALERPARPKPPPKPAPRRRWPLAVLLLLVVVAVAGLAAHRPIARAWPASAPFFVSLGLR